MIFITQNRKESLLSEAVGKFLMSTAFLTLMQTVLMIR